MNWLRRMLGLGAGQGSGLSATVEYTVKPHTGGYFNWEASATITYSDGVVIPSESLWGGVTEYGSTRWGAAYAAKREARRRVKARRKSMSTGNSKKTWTEKL